MRGLGSLKSSIARFAFRPIVLAAAWKRDLKEAR